MAQVKNAIADLILYVCFLSMQNCGIQSKSICARFGVLECGYQRYIGDSDVTLYTEQDCEGVSAHQTFCASDAGTSSTSINEQCRNKERCEVGVSRCQLESEIYTSASIIYSCKYPMGPARRFSGCFNFGRIDCGNEIIRIKKVQYYIDVVCSKNKSVIDRCSENAESTSTVAVRQKCDGYHSCDFVISRCPSTWWHYQSTKIKYECVKGSPLTRMGADQNNTAIGIASTTGSTNTRLTSVKSTMTGTTQSISYSFSKSTKIYNTSNLIRNEDNIGADRSLVLPREQTHSKTGQIIGGVVGGLVSLCAVVALIVIIVRCLRSKRLPPAQSEGDSLSSMRKTNEYDQSASIYSTINDECVMKTGSQHNGKNSVPTITSTGNLLEVPVLHLSDKEAMSSFRSLPKDVAGNAEVQCIRSQRQNDELHSYLVIESDEQPPIIPIPERHESNIENSAGLASRVTALNHNYYALEETVECNQAVYELAKVVHPDKDTGADAYNASENINSPCRYDARQDKYGYSHIAGIERSIPICDGTYEHIAITENDKDRCDCL